MTSSPRRQVVRFVSPSSPSSSTEQAHLVEPNITSTNNKKKLRLPQTLPDLDCSKHEKCVANKGQTIMTTITTSMTTVTTASVPGSILMVGRIAVFLCILSVLTNVGFESLRGGGSTTSRTNSNSWMLLLSRSKLLSDDTNSLTPTSKSNLRYNPVIAATFSTDGGDEGSDDDDSLALASRHSKENLNDTTGNMTGVPMNRTTEGNDGDKDDTSVAAAAAIPIAAINEDSLLRPPNATTNPPRPVSVNKIIVSTDTTTPKTTPTMTTHAAADKNNDGDDDEASKVAEALVFVDGRRHAYKEQHFQKEWMLRGIGYLYTHHHIALMAHVPQQHDPLVKQAESGDGHSNNNNNSVIRIVNVHPNKTIADDNNRNYCDLLTIWVRVNGPEIFAGRAQAVRYAKGSSCHWEFPFDLQIQGNYTVDAKVLVWNGLAPIGGNDRSQCEFTKGNINRTALQELYPKHTGFVGYKVSFSVLLARAAGFRDKRHGVLFEFLFSYIAFPTNVFFLYMLLLFLSLVALPTKELLRNLHQVSTALPLLDIAAFWNSQSHVWHQRLRTLL